MSKKEIPSSEDTISNILQEKTLETTETSNSDIPKKLDSNSSMNIRSPDCSIEKNEKTQQEDSSILTNQSSMKGVPESEPVDKKVLIKDTNKAKEGEKKSLSNTKVGISEIVSNDLRISQFMSAFDKKLAESGLLNTSGSMTQGNTETTRRKLVFDEEIFKNVEIYTTKYVQPVKSPIITSLPFLSKDPERIKESPSAEDDALSSKLEKSKGSKSVWKDLTISDGDKMNDLKRVESKKIKMKLTFRKPESWPQVKPLQKPADDEIDIKHLTDSGNKKDSKSKSPIKHNKIAPSEEQNLNISTNLQDERFFSAESSLNKTKSSSTFENSPTTIIKTGNSDLLNTSPGSMNETIPLTPNETNHRKPFEEKTNKINTSDADVSMLKIPNLINQNEKVIESSRSFEDISILDEIKLYPNISSTKAINGISDSLKGLNHVKESDGSNQNFCNLKVPSFNSSEKVENKSFMQSPFNLQLYYSLLSQLVHEEKSNSQILNQPIHSDFLPLLNDLDLAIKSVEEKSTQFNIHNVNSLRRISAMLFSATEDLNKIESENSSFDRQFNVMLNDTKLLLREIQSRHDVQKTIQNLNDPVVLSKYLKQFLDFLSSSAITCEQNLEVLEAKIAQFDDRDPIGSVNDLEKAYQKVNALYVRIKSKTNEIGLTIQEIHHRIRSAVH